MADVIEGSPALDPQMRGFDPMFDPLLAPGILGETLGGFDFGGMDPGLFIDPFTGGAAEPLFWDTQENRVVTQSQALALSQGGGANIIGRSPVGTPGFFPTSDLATAIHLGELGGGLQGTPGAAQRRLDELQGRTPSRLDQLATAAILGSTGLGLAGALGGLFGGDRTQQTTVRPSQGQSATAAQDRALSLASEIAGGLFGGGLPGSPALEPQMRGGASLRGGFPTIPPAAQTRLDQIFGAQEAGLVGTTESLLRRALNEGRQRGFTFGIEEGPVRQIVSENMPEIIRQARMLQGQRALTELDLATKLSGQQIDLVRALSGIGGAIPAGSTSTTTTPFRLIDALSPFAQTLGGAGQALAALRALQPQTPQTINVRVQ